jgi:hypothetical protein
MFLFLGQWTDGTEHYGQVIKRKGKDDGELPENIEPGIVV